MTDQPQVRLSMFSRCVLKTVRAAVRLEPSPDPTQNLTQQNPNQVDAFAVLSEAVTLYEAERLGEIDTRAARGGS